MEAKRPDNYPATPTLDRMSEIKEESQAIGEFLDWLLYTKRAAIYQHFPTFDNGEPAWIDTRTGEKAEPGMFLSEHVIANPDHDFRPEGYYHLRASIEELLAEFFQIDLVAKSREKEAILAYIRNMEEQQ